MRQIRIKGLGYLIIDPIFFLDLVYSNTTNMLPCFLYFHPSIILFIQVLVRKIAL
jgi:hypothetical protein